MPHGVPEFALLGLFAAAALAWSGLTIAALLGLRSMPDPAPPSGEPEGEAPSCTIVLAARDEGARLEQTVRRALAQRGVDVRVVAVDDRSSDETPAILARLARDDARLATVRVDSLPSGWLGKCHALHEGSRRARGEWLLFIDADTWLAPDAARTGIDLAARTGARHVCFGPAMASTTLAGRATLLAGMTLFAARALGVHWPRSGVYMGVGGYNLIDAGVYRSFGGHAPLRMEVVDDVKLALLANRAGARTRIALAPRLVEVEWAGSTRGFVRLLEKNGFASMNYSIVRTGAMSVVALGMLLAPLGAGAVVAFAGGGALRVAAGLCVIGWLASILPSVALAPRFGWGIPGALLAPLGFWTILVAGVNSAGTTLARGGVTWRGTRYPLRELRGGVVR